MTGQQLQLPFPPVGLPTFEYVGEDESGAPTWLVTWPWQRPGSREVRDER